MGRRAARQLRSRLLQRACVLLALALLQHSNQRGGAVHLQDVHSGLLMLQRPLRNRSLQLLQHVRVWLCAARASSLALLGQRLC